MARVQTSAAVRLTLYSLLIYVIVMLLLILVRFLRIFPLPSHPPKKAAVVSVWPGGERYALRGYDSRA